MQLWYQKSSNERNIKQKIDNQNSVTGINFAITKCWANWKMASYLSWINSVVHYFQPSFKSSYLEKRDVCMAYMIKSYCWINPLRVVFIQACLDVRNYFGAHFLVSYGVHTLWISKVSMYELVIIKAFARHM